VRFEEGFNAVAELKVILACVAQEGSTVVRGELDRGIEKRFFAFKALVHKWGRVWFTSRSRCRKAYEQGIFATKRP
jgi:hypothetical protein